VKGVFAFLDVLLGGAALVVKPGDPVRLHRQVGDDEADAGNSSPGCHSILAITRRGLSQLCRLILEVLVEALHLGRMLRLSHAEAVLERLEHEALEAKTDSTRVRALELIGRHLGMFTDKVEITTQERSVEMIEQEIRDRLVRFGFVDVVQLNFSGKCSALLFG
jgi:hypothetical protein